MGGWRKKKKKKMMMMMNYNGVFLVSVERVWRVVDSLQELVGVCIERDPKGELRIERNK